VIATGKQVLHYKKGETIFREGEEARGIYFIVEGSVKVHRSWGAGNEFILRFATAGDVVGHRGHGVPGGFPISATVLDTTTVCFITSEFLEILFQTDHRFLYAMMQLYASELQAAEKRMRDLALRPVKGRVAQALLTLRDVFGTDGDQYLKIPITRLDIACYAGTTYEAVFRLLKDWSGTGLVSTSGKYIRIDDEERLCVLVQ
jgi:CRP/FNR family transcriptional regulator